MPRLHISSTVLVEPHIELYPYMCPFDRIKLFFVTSSVVAPSISQVIRQSGKININSFKIEFIQPIVEHGPSYQMAMTPSLVSTVRNVHCPNMGRAPSFMDHVPIKLCTIKYLSETALVGSGLSIDKFCPAMLFG